MPKYIIELGLNESNESLRHVRIVLSLGMETCPELVCRINDHSDLVEGGVGVLWV